jgi:ferrous iron transport protein A
MDSLLLSEIGIKEPAELVSVENKALELRLLAMGCTPGERIYVERKAFYGDPILIRMEGSLLSIRKSDAKQITVKKAL